jgi:hypothetical protein
VTVKQTLLYLVYFVGWLLSSELQKTLKWEILLNVHLKERDHLRDLDIDGMIALECIFVKDVSYSELAQDKAQWH